MGARHGIRAALLAGVVLSGPALADDLADAQRAYAAGDYATAAITYHGLAQAGNAAAQYNLGLIYLRGRGLPQSFENALFWGWKAKLSGLSDADSLLLTLKDLTAEDVIRRTADRLLESYMIEIDAGEPAAMVAYARVLVDLHPKPDMETAFVWLSIAAALGADGAERRRDIVLSQIEEAKRAAAQQKTTDEMTAWCERTSASVPVCALLF
ncbi:MAG: sel1 repeat family protein [Marivivens sp.]|nr:sel1 repeat family protein [Marivivens sp.]